MKAAQLVKSDGKPALAITEVQQPQVKEGKVLVEVHEAGVNPFDWKMRDGNMDLPLPLTLGNDFAGVVKDVGSGVEGLTPGDEVYGMAGFFNEATGTFAQYDLVDPRTVAPRPAKVNETEAGALPLTGVMALEALTEMINLSRGQKILIQGGAGGIGSVAIQIAKNLGAHVAVTCATDQIDYVMSLGADEAIDYRTQRFEDVVHDFDAVYDLVGGDVYRKSYQVLRRGGVIVSSLEQPDDELTKKFQVKAIYEHFEVTTERLMRLAQLVDEGVVHVHVEKTFPLDEANEALDYQRDVHPRGKVVIDVKQQT
jgi:NADPH:quinone reductase-like Zn-dependent oxidoreductase